ncbi:MAG: hypothetical protein ABEJ44_02700 [Halanaeroarchaeum sp.]
MTEHEHTLSGPKWLFGIRAAVHALLPVALIAIVGVLYLEYLAHVEGLHHEVVLVERAVLGYFVVHVAIEFALYDDKRDFLRDNWLDVLLIVPFLTVFRLVGEIGEALRGARALSALGGLESGDLLEQVAAVTVVGVVDADEALIARETVEESRLGRTSARAGAREGRLAYLVRRSSTSRLRLGGVVHTALKKAPTIQEVGHFLRTLPRGAGKLRQLGRYILEGVTAAVDWLSDAIPWLGRGGEQ